MPLSSRDRLEAALVEAATPAHRHVFTAMMAASACAEADAADARRRAGQMLGPLDGVLVSIKDLFDVAGSITCAGSKIRRDAPAATQDAPVIARMRQAGAVLIGRTNMSEFAFSGLGLNPHWGTPGNAIDPARIPGGSSSGAAVSVARELCPLALGTDTGGSTRIPAAFNGIVGFKPTSPRVPREGAFPLSYTLDSIGPLGASVAECAAADRIMAGEAPTPLPALALAGLRIGIPRGLLFEATEPEVAAAFEAGIATLAQRGAMLKDCRIDDLILEMRQVLASAPIVACEAAEIHAEAILARPQDFDQRVLKRILAGHTVLARDYVHALRARERLKAAFAPRMAGFDVLALPTCPLVAPLRAPLENDDALFSATNLLSLRNTSVANFFDLPAISLPLPVSGLPVGLMLVGAAMADHKVFTIAATIEHALKD